MGERKSVRERIRWFAVKTVGRAANLFPGHYFYSDRLFEDWRWNLASDKSEFEPFSSSNTEKSFAAIVMAVAVGADRGGMRVGDEWSGKFHGVTDAGRQCGDYEIIVRKIGDNSRRPQHDASRKTGAA